MTDFKAQTRRDGDARNTRAEPSRHRAEPAKPASALSRFARNFGVTGRRTAVVAAACAVLVGVGAAGQAVRDIRPQRHREQLHGGTHHGQSPDAARL